MSCFSDVFLFLDHQVNRNGFFYGQRALDLAVGTSMQSILGSERRCRPLCTLGRRGAGGGAPRPSPLRWTVWDGVRTRSELHGAMTLVGSDGEVLLLPDREQPRRRLLMHRAVDPRRLREADWMEVLRQMKRAGMAEVRRHS